MDERRIASLFRGDLIGRLDQARASQGACCVVNAGARAASPLSRRRPMRFCETRALRRIDWSSSTTRAHTTHAHANCSHCVAAMNPSVGLVTVKRLPRMCSRRDHRSPLCLPLAAHDFRNFPAACPDAIKSRESLSLFPRFSRAHQEEHPCASSRHNSRRSAGLCRSALRSTRNLHGVPAFRPRGWFISVSARRRSSPLRLPFRRATPPDCRVLDLFHEGAGPVFNRQRNPR